MSVDSLHWRDSLRTDSQDYGDGARIGVRDGARIGARDGARDGAREHVHSASDVWDVKDKSNRYGRVERVRDGHEKSSYVEGYVEERSGSHSGDRLSHTGDSTEDHTGARSEARVADRTDDSGRDTDEFSLQDMPDDGQTAAEPADGDRIDKEVPDSGWRAWLVVVGAFSANVTTVGFVNSSGTVQDYLMTHNFKGESESTVGWIFSLYIFLMFFCGIQTGPIVDMLGIKPVLLPGCILWCTALFIMSVCTDYYQFILAFSVLGGISSSLIYNPSYTVISQWFTTKKSVALGFVAVGGSIAGSFLPIVLSSLFESVGYGWTMRILAFMFVGLSVVACVTMQSRRRVPGKIRWKDISIDLHSLRSAGFSWCVLGMTLSEWAFFLPSLYIVDYSRNILGYTNQDANLLLVYLNIASTFGRIGSGYAGRYYGPFNTMIVVTLVAGLSSLCIWLPAGLTRGGITAFAVVFGIFSGAGMSTGPTCVATISNSTNFGRRYGTTYALISLAVLTSLPIGGALAKGEYVGMKVITGVAYVASTGAFVAAKWYEYGNKWIA